MSCEQYRELISADLDGELGPDEEAQLWPHLSDCSDCRAWRRDQLVIRTELHKWPQEDLPAQIAEPPLRMTTARTVVYRIPRVWAWAAGILLLIQGAVTVGVLSSGTSHVPTMTDDSDDQVETITLTADDRVRYTVQTTDARDKNNTIQPNGG